MIAFINDHSLEQYCDWGESLRFFLRAARELVPASALLLKDGNFFLQPHFKQRFNTLGLAGDERALIRELVFGSRYYRCWRPIRISNSTETYVCSVPRLNLIDASLCEAAERKLVDPASAVSLLSASNSAFTGTDPVVVARVSSQNSSELRNASTIAGVKQWIVGERGYYDPASTASPRDFQTILLKAPHRFRATGKVERRFCRSIYQEVDTGRLCYVDDGHPGHSAHLEVFSATGEHLGTADIVNATLNEANRIAGRMLKL